MNLKHRLKAATDLNDGNSEWLTNIDELHNSFIKEMDDDFNTPGAISVLFDLTKQINKEEGTKASELAGRLKLLASVLGILEQDPNTFLTSGANNDDNAEIEALVKERNDARKAKDWARADAARDKLKAMHIELEDTPQGTVWHRV